MARGARQQEAASLGLDQLLVEGTVVGRPSWARVSRRVRGAPEPGDGLSVASTPVQWWRSLQRNRPVAAFDRQAGQVRETAIPGGALSDVLTLAAETDAFAVRLAGASDRIEISRSVTGEQMHVDLSHSEQVWASIEVPRMTVASDFVARFGAARTLDHRNDEGLQLRVNDRELVLSDTPRGTYSFPIGVDRLAHVLDAMRHESVLQMEAYAPGDHEVATLQFSPSRRGAWLFIRRIGEAAGISLQLPGDVVDRLLDDNRLAT